MLQITQVTRVDGGSSGMTDLKQKLKDVIDLDDLYFPLEDTLVKVRNGGLAYEVYATGDMAYSLKGEPNTLFFSATRDIDDQIEELLDQVV